jgi:hypothetical protein
MATMPGTGPQSPCRARPPPLEYLSPDAAPPAASTRRLIRREQSWLATDVPAVILVEVDAMAPLLTALADWDDVFDITIVPAVTAEEGMRFAKERLAHQELALR